MHGSQFARLLSDRVATDELREMIEAGIELPGMAALGVSGDELRRALAAPSGLESIGAGAPGVASGELEAIVRLHNRPSLLVQHGTFALPDSQTWRRRLTPSLSSLERSIRSVGRINLHAHHSLDWVGTGWVIAENTVITNRHVALEFAQLESHGYVVTQHPQAVQVELDFRGEHQVSGAQRVSVEQILWVSGDPTIDMALLRLSGEGLPSPIPLAKDDPQRDHFVAVIGYPARDSRNQSGAMARIFGDIYDVKRLAPGQVTEVPDNPNFQHDCSTLGGNSGSAVIDLETGDALGLHFGGKYREVNHAVKASAIEEALSATSVSVSVAPAQSLGDGQEAARDRTRALSYYEGREGYDPEFLGTGEHRVELPALDLWHADAAKVVGAPPDSDYVACYTHFSVVLSASRKMPLFTAVNIDGGQAQRTKRGGDRWFLDPRLEAAQQLGYEVYRGNDLDRGHMVRRLDPVWGDREEARRADEDTFHYVNSCPQHKDMNRRTWLRLEDYVLDNAASRDLKVSVFTGPVLAESDAPYRDLVRLPSAFWKIAVVVDANTGQLSATGYLLSQSGLIEELAEFRYGRFETFQVPIAGIEDKVGLKFDRLAAHDPYLAADLAEGTRRRGRVIRGPQDMVL